MAKSEEYLATNTFKPKGGISSALNTNSATALLVIPKMVLNFPEIGTT